jgi:tetratricopeptide (TPR) repeat protein
MPVHHYGKLKEDKVMTKGEDYFLLGMEKLRESNDSKALFELAVQAGELDLFEDAIDLWEQFLRLNDQPKELVLRAYINIGHAFVQTRRYDEAFAASRKAMELAPDSPGAVMNYSLSELWRGDLQKAVPFLEELLKSIPDYPPATGMLAVASLLAGEGDSAKILFGKLKAHGFLPEPYLLNHARKQIEADMVDRAIALLENATAAGFGSEELVSLLEECRKSPAR